MPRRRSRQYTYSGLELLFVVMVLLSAVVFTVDYKQFAGLALLVVVGIAVIVVCASIVLWRWRSSLRIRRYKSLTMTDIDSMDGIEFEHFLAGLLPTVGFTEVQFTKAQGDKGADLLGVYDGKKYAIQVKRYNWMVKIDALYQAAGGMGYYHCDKAMVITNSTYTPDAYVYAKEAGMWLVDRPILEKWVRQFHTRKE